MTAPTAPDRHPDCTRVVLRNMGKMGNYYSICDCPDCVRDGIELKLRRYRLEPYCAVELKREIEGFPVGQFGIVVDIADNGTLEVELFDDQTRTIGVVTVPIDDCWQLRRIYADEDEHCATLSKIANDMMTEYQQTGVLPAGWKTIKGTTVEEIRKKIFGDDDD